MPRRLKTQCRTCQHREAGAIDLALARGVSVTALSRRYGIHTDALYRHRAAHLTPALRAKLLQGPDTDIDLDRLRETESQSLLAHLIALRRRLFASFDFAEEHGDTRMVTSVAAQLHHNLEITGKLLGSLAVGGGSVTARQAVAGVLHQIESTAAANSGIDPRELAS
jgi:transposase-like protein